MTKGILIQIMKKVWAKKYSSNTLSYFIFWSDKAIPQMNGHMWLLLLLFTEMVIWESGKVKETEEKERLIYFLLLLSCINSILSNPKYGIGEISISLISLIFILMAFLALVLSIIPSFLALTSRCVPFLERYPYIWKHYLIPLSCLIWPLLWS